MQIDNTCYATFFVGTEPIGVAVFPNKSTAKKAINSGLVTFEGKRMHFLFTGHVYNQYEAIQKGLVKWQNNPTKTHSIQ